MIVMYVLNGGIGPLTKKKVRDNKKIKKGPQHCDRELENSVIFIWLKMSKSTFHEDIILKIENGGQGRFPFCPILFLLIN